MAQDFITSATYYSQITLLEGDYEKIKTIIIENISMNFLMINNFLS